MLPTFPELAFDDATHTYCLNGAILPSVSAIMRPLSQALYKGVDEAALAAAAVRGTAVHNAIESYILYGIKDIPHEYGGYLEAFIKWWTDNKPEPLGTECRVYHRVLRYAGTVDLPAVVRGKLLVVDYKTTAVVNEMLTGVQTAAYAKAYESHGFGFDGKAILHLSNDETYDWLYYDKNDRESWETFGALLTVHNHIKKYKERR